MSESDSRDELKKRFKLIKGTKEGPPPNIQPIEINSVDELITRMASISPAIKNSRQIQQRIRKMFDEKKN